MYLLYQTFKKVKGSILSKNIVTLEIDIISLRKGWQTKLIMCLIRAPMYSCRVKLIVRLASCRSISCQLIQVVR